MPLGKAAVQASYAQKEYGMIRSESRSGFALPEMEIK